MAGSGAACLAMPLQRATNQRRSAGAVRSRIEVAAPEHCGPGGVAEQHQVNAKGGPSGGAGRFIRPLGELIGRGNGLEGGQRIPAEVEIEQVIQDWTNRLPEHGPGFGVGHGGDGLASRQPTREAVPPLRRTGRIPMPRCYGRPAPAGATTSAGGGDATLTDTSGSVPTRHCECPSKRGPVEQIGRGAGRAQSPRGCGQPGLAVREASTAGAAMPFGHTSW